MNKLNEILEKEFRIINEMVETAEQQQEALRQYDIISIERTTLKLNELSREMKQFEEERINFLIKVLRLSRKEALTAKLTEIANKIEIADSILQKRGEITQLIEKLAYISSLNRLLINRALMSINEILSTLSNPQNSVCNVRI